MAQMKFSFFFFIIKYRIYNSGWGVIGLWRTHSIEFYMTQKLCESFAMMANGDYLKFASLYNFIRFSLT